jgi:hypothetical protein
MPFALDTCIPRLVYLNFLPFLLSFAPWGTQLIVTVTLPLHHLKKQSDSFLHHLSQISCSLSNQAASRPILFPFFLIDTIDTLQDLLIDKLSLWHHHHLDTQPPVASVCATLISYRLSHVLMSLLFSSLLSFFPPFPPHSFLLSLQSDRVCPKVLFLFLCVLLLLLFIVLIEIAP